VLVSYFLFRAAPARTQPSPYLGSIQAETARVEVLEYLGRTQLFLLSLFDGSSGCTDGEAGGGPEREFARRLIYQKKLLEPRLVSPDFEDLRPILNELELFLLDIATRDGCLEDRELRSSVLSIGIPILLADGRLLRGPVIKIPPYRGNASEAVDPDRIDQWADSGWVDLREGNIHRWIGRAQAILSEIEALPEEDTSSRYHHDRSYWQPDEPIDIGKTVAWIFIREDKGERMK